MCIAYAHGDAGEVRVLPDPLNPRSRWIRAGSVEQPSDEDALNSGFLSAACAAPAACLLSTGSGLLLRSTEIGATPTSWTQLNADLYTSLLDCYSTALCVAESNGIMISSTDAFSGSTWTDVQGAPRGPAKDPTTAVSCVSDELCFAFKAAKGHMLFGRLTR